MNTVNGSKPQSNGKGMVIASWILLGLSCAGAMIPGLGFGMWLIATPVLLATLILSILLLTKGRTTQGVLILLASLIGAPIFIAIVPFLSTGAAVVAAEAANEVSMQAANNRSQSVQAETLKVGDIVKFRDSQWVIVEATDRGKRISGSMGARNTEGKFVYVRYRVTNDTNGEDSLFAAPVLRDSRGRTYKQADDQEFLLPMDEIGIVLQALPAGMPKSFSAIYEVPADATGLKFMARSLSSQSTTKPVDLGL